MSALKFRILLDTANDDEIFRDVLIDESNSFESFYKIILQSFNFSGQEMASFYVSNDQWDKGHEISLMDLSNDEDTQINCSTMNNTIIKDFINQKDQKFIFIYDFLNMWIFLIELIGKEDGDLSSPKLILEVGNSPNENENKNLNTLIFENQFPEEDSEIDSNDLEEDYYDY